MGPVTQRRRRLVDVPPMPSHPAPGVQSFLDAAVGAYRRPVLVAPEVLHGVTSGPTLRAGYGTAPDAGDELVLIFEGRLPSNIV